jgi:hypothetical protein
MEKIPIVVEHCAYRYFELDWLCRNVSSLNYGNACYSGDESAYPSGCCYVEVESMILFGGLSKDGRY